MTIQTIVRSAALVIGLVASSAQADSPIDGWPQLGWGTEPDLGVTLGDKGDFGNPYANVVLPDGSSILISPATSLGYSSTGLTKLTIQGLLDETFGTLGYAVPEMPIQGFSDFATLDKKDQLLVAGRSVSDLFLCRLSTVTGAPLNFEGSSHSCVSVDDGISTSGLQVIVQPDGKFLVVNSGSNLNTGDFNSVAITRVNVNGVIDQSYGNQGTVVLKLKGPIYQARLASNGKLALLGGDHSFFHEQGTLTRLDAMGNVDVGWLERWIELPYHQIPDFETAPSLLGVEDDILVVGTLFFLDNLNVGVVARIDGINGVLDPSFGIYKGYQLITVGNNWGFGRIANRGNDGWVLLGAPGGSPLTIVGITSSGVVDVAFGNNGYFKLTIPPLPFGVAVTGTSMRLRGDGIYIAGYAVDANYHYNWLELKLNRDRIFADDAELY